jgi:hypothetical protein
MSMNRSLVLASVLVACLSACSVRAECGGVPGTYSSESESEWDVRLTLRADGTGDLVREDWIAGKERRTTSRRALNWTCDDRTVEVRYDGVVEHLSFSPELSLEVMGFPEAHAPGLIRVGEKPAESLLWGTYFWNMEKVSGKGPK